MPAYIMYALIVIKNSKSNFDWPKELTIIIRTDLFSSKPPAGFILGQKVPGILLWHFQDFTRYITIGGIKLRYGNQCIIHLDRDLFRG